VSIDEVLPCVCETADIARCQMVATPANPDLQRACALATIAGWV